MPAPPPVNPEDRALERITYLRDWLKVNPKASTHMKTHIVRQIRRLEAVAREYIPTRYLPAALRGGKS